MSQPYLFHLDSGIVKLLSLLYLHDCQGRAWGQNQSTQGVGMGGGVPLPYVRKKNQSMN